MMTTPYPGPMPLFDVLAFDPSRPDADFHAAVEDFAAATEHWKAAHAQRAKEHLTGAFDAFVATVRQNLPAPGVRPEDGVYLPVLPDSEFTRIDDLTSVFTHPLYLRLQERLGDLGIHLYPLFRSTRGEGAGVRVRVQRLSTRTVFDAAEMVALIRDEVDEAT